MSAFFTSLTPALAEFIRQQPVFFTASAAGSGRINCSPKGAESLRVLDDRKVAYLDVTGSGNETSAHILNDGRLTIMLCSFGSKPLILRLYGRGEVVQPGDGPWQQLMRSFTSTPGQRQIVVLHIDSIQTSCGFGVPKMEFIDHRNGLAEWASRKTEAELTAYRASKNSKSIDGFPTGLHGSPGPG